jgi:mannose-6-phosphate isomerase-like protein (cupin superfamily)
MKIINTNTLEEGSWRSPKGIYNGAGKQVSIALGRKPESMDLNERHPFDVEICRIKAGKKLCPFHSHSAQWEFYHVISGKGQVRDEEDVHAIEPGDAFLFKPGEAHQIINNGSEDLIFYIIADNPVGESCHYPDSGKWLVRSPEPRLIRSEPIDYFEGEE